MNLEEYLAIPFVVEAWSEPTNGGWVCHAGLPELPECDLTGPHALEVFQRLDEQRIDAIIARFQAGKFIPVPRAPLRTSPA